jgi:hypothetical protein
MPPCFGSAAAAAAETVNMATIAAANTRMLCMLSSLLFGLRFFDSLPADWPGR